MIKSLHSNKIDFVKYQLTILVLILPFLLLSQTAQKGFDLMNQTKYSESIEVFGKAIEKNKDVLASKYGLALVYSNPLYQKFKYNRAYRNLISAEKLYLKLSGNDMASLKKDFNIDDISFSNLKKKILDEAFAEAKKEGTSESLRNYFEDFPNTEQSRAAKLLMINLEFRNIVKENNPKSLNEFIKKYHGTVEADSAKYYLGLLEDKAYNYYSWEGELESLLEFQKYYPDYKNKTQFQKDYELAGQAFKLDLDEAYNSNMEIVYGEYIKKAAPVELAYVALIRTIESFVANKQWNLAIEQLEKYKSYFQDDIRIDKVIDILRAPEKTLLNESLSSHINSEGHEYAPVVTGDGLTLYFCGRNREGNIGGEDIFVSKFKEGNWTKPGLLNSINTPYAHEAPLAISADGSRLLLYANTDIYYSDRLINGWTISKVFPEVNTVGSWEADAFISADGNAIFFISDRIGNLGNIHKFGETFHGSHSGNSDIYISLQTEEGWTKPFNIGKSINTPFSERSPFLHPDMKTLYFSSDGHAGLGKLDVFKSVRLSDTSWTKWSEPVNLGKEINSSSDDYDYRISTNGKSALLSSFKPGNYDIQKIDIPESVRPEFVATVWGTISNRDGKPIQSRIKWEDLKEGKTIGLLQSDIIDGSYLILLPLGKNYGYFIDDPNYYPLSGNIDLSDKTEELKIRKDFVLFSNSEIINEGIAVPLENVFFELNKFILKKESFPELNRLITFLKKNQNLKIEIGGHTDNTGTVEHNNKLSEQRANSVKDYLLKNAITGERLVAIGYGSNKPIDDNKTEAGRAKNRRVEFKVLTR